MARESLLNTRKFGTVSEKGDIGCYWNKKVIYVHSKFLSFIESFWSLAFFLIPNFETC